MSPVRRLFRVVSLASFALLLTACGNKGALYKPATAPEATPKMVPVAPIKTPPAPTPDADGN